jgi:hypothetical protein
MFVQVDYDYLATTATCSRTNTSSHEKYYNTLEASLAVSIHMRISMQTTNCFHDTRSLNARQAAGHKSSRSDVFRSQSHTRTALDMFRIHRRATKSYAHAGMYMQGILPEESRRSS